MSNSTATNIKTIAKGAVNVPLEVGAAAVQVTADSVDVATSGVRATPGVIKAILRAPFEAASGYIQEAEGVTRDEAQERAFRYLKQDLAQTIDEGAEASGKLLAEFLKDDDDNADAKKADADQQ